MWWIPTSLDGRRMCFLFVIARDPGSHVMIPNFPHSSKGSCCVLLRVEAPMARSNHHTRQGASRKWGKSSHDFSVKARGEQLRVETRYVRFKSKVRNGIYSRAEGERRGKESTRTPGKEVVDFTHEAEMLHTANSSFYRGTTKNFPGGGGLGSARQSQWWEVCVCACWLPGLRKQP